MTHITRTLWICLSVTEHVVDFFESGIFVVVSVYVMSACNGWAFCRLLFDSVDYFEWFRFLILCKVLDNAHAWSLFIRSDQACVLWAIFFAPDIISHVCVDFYCARWCSWIIAEKSHCVSYLCIAVWVHCTYDCAWLHMLWPYWLH